METKNQPNATSIQIFNNSQFGELRTSENESNVLFCLNDVMKSLELNHVTNLKKRLNEKGCTTNTVLTNGGNQSMIFIDEPNLYRCIFQSRKKEAQQFQDWVVEEILPTIRKNGGYIHAPIDETPEMIMARALKVAEQTLNNHAERVKVLEEEKQSVEFMLQLSEGEKDELQKVNQKLAPKATYTDEVLQSTTTYTLTQIAHDLDMRSVYVLTSWLTKKGILFYQSKQWQPTAKVAGKHYFATRTAKYIKDGEVHSSLSTVVTELGRAWLHTLYKQEGGML